MCDIYIYASYGTSLILLGGLVALSFRQLARARKDLRALEQDELA